MNLTNNIVELALMTNNEANRESPTLLSTNTGLDNSEIYSLLENQKQLGIPESKIGVRDGNSVWRYGATRRDSQGNPMYLRDAPTVGGETNAGEINRNNLDFFRRNLS